jgi:hypothetical protein
MPTGNNCGQTMPTNDARHENPDVAFIMAADDFSQSEGFAPDRETYRDLVEAALRIARPQHPSEQAETIANALEAGRTHAIERECREGNHDKLIEIRTDIALIERAQAIDIANIEGELTEVRAERDALLQKPIDLAKMDSIDDDATDRMIAYYWWQQAQDARAALTPTQDTVSIGGGNG